jgi:hypothetical protein
MVSSAQGPRLSPDLLDIELHRLCQDASTAHGVCWFALTRALRALRQTRVNEPISIFEVDILTQLINSDAPQDRFVDVDVDVAAASEGVRLLLAAGRVHSYDSCHFREAGALHRKLLILGARRLTDAFDIASTFDVPDQPQTDLDEAWNEFLQWSSKTKVRMFGPLHPPTDGEKQILAWLKESIALLGLTAKHPGQRGIEIASALVRSVIRTLCEVLAFTDTGVSDNGNLNRIIQDAALMVRSLASEQVETLVSVSQPRSEEHRRCTRSRSGKPRAPWLAWLAFRM